MNQRLRTTSGKKRGLLVTAVSLSCLLCACTGGLLQTKFDVPTTYVLAPIPAADNPSTNGSAVVDLMVAIPAPAPGLDSERIATLQDVRRLDYYKDAQWGGTAAQVMQSMVVTSLQNQQLFRSVTPEQARVSATHLLDLQLRDFQAEYATAGAAPKVHVTLVASLIRLKDRKLLASFPVTATVAAQENRLGAVVAAFESASQQAVLALGKQTQAAMNSDAN